MNMEYSIRYKNDEDNEWISKSLIQNWGTDFIVSKQVKHFAQELNGYIAETPMQIVGICLYTISNDECEIVLLESYNRNKGIGTSLLNKLKEKEYNRLWLITTNDNLDALAFYQKRGFRLVKIYRNEIAKSRILKPEIPEIGNYGIAIRDEIEMELMQTH